MKVLLEVFKYTGPYNRKLVFINTIMCVSMGLNIIHPLIFGRFIDYVTNKEVSNALKIILFIAILFLINLGIKFIQKYYLAKLIANIQIDVKLKMVKRIMAKDMDDYQLIPKGEMMNKIENDTKAFSNVLSELLNIFIDCISILVVFIILLNINLLLVSILFITCPLTLFIFKFYGKKIRKKDISVKQSLDHYLTYLGELLSSFKLFKLLNNEAEGVNRYSQKNDLVYKLSLEKMLLNIKSGTIIEFINYISYLLILILGVYLIYKGDLTIGILIAFTSYSNNFNQSFLRFGQLNTFFQEAIVSINRVKNLLDVPAETKCDVNNMSSHMTIPSFEEGRMVLCNVCYEYSNEFSPIFKNINIAIPLKKIVLFKGVSGSGKTTLLNILSGLYVGYTGEILINQYNVKNIPHHIYKKKICLVSQNHFLLSGTIKENLLLANPDATNEDLIKVCKLVNIYDFITSLENNFDTLIGHNGLDLSTGQQQRLSIARSLLRDAEIYLFDEITASLDKENQSIIESLLIYLNKVKGKTIVLVTHDSMIKNAADLTFEVKNGQIHQIQSVLFPTF